MKKIAYAVMALAMSLGMTIHPACAQDNPNHVSLAVSESAPISLAMALGGALGAAIAAPTGATLDLGLYGSYTAAYERVLPPEWLAVGGELVVVPVKIRFTREDGSKTGSGMSTFLMAMPTAKFHYLRRDHVQLYGKVAAGAAATLQDRSESDADESGTALSFVFQADPIGVRFGGPRVGGFLELGIGLRGILNLGIDFAF